MKTKRDKKRRGARGFVMLSAMAVIFILSTMAYLAIQQTGFYLYITVTEYDVTLLNATAESCIDLIVKRVRDDFTTSSLTPDPFAAWIPNPNPSVDPPAQVVDHHIMGHGRIMHPNCSGGGISPNCLCRTGFLYDGRGLFFKYDMNNSRHRGRLKETEVLREMADATTTNLGEILRFGNRATHVIKVPAGNAPGEPDKRMVRWFGNFAVSVNNSTREYVFLIEGGPVMKDSYGTN